LDWPVRIMGPAALGQLLREDIIGRLAAAFVLLAAEEGHQQNPFRLQNRVALQLADPVAVVLLEAQHTTAGVLDGAAHRERGGVRTEPRRGGRSGSQGMCFVHGTPSVRTNILVDRISATAVLYTFSANARKMKWQAAASCQ